LAKFTKNRKAALEKFDKNQRYSLDSATSIVKDMSYVKFDEAVELAVKLGVEPKKPNQMVRGSVNLPHGTGKDTKVLALVKPEKEAEAKQAGADYVGLDDYLKKFDEGWTDVDVIVTTPDVMPQLGKYGKILGPRGLMPNPKTGTVTQDINGVVQETKAGKIDFKVDRYGIVHTIVGRRSFDNKQLYENALEVIQTLYRLKPSASKGAYFRNIHISCTMTPSVNVDVKTIPGI